jgi:hypothetical protein
MRQPALPLVVIAALLLHGPGCPTEPAPGPPPYVQPAPWDELTPAERDMFMEELFSPVMKEHFQAFDPARYAAFSCVTCHGEDAEATGYAMPADVGPIGLSDVPVEEIEDPERREIAVWMDEVVLPEMGRLLEQELTLQGASCLDCHTFEAGL